MEVVNPFPDSQGLMDHPLFSYVEAIGKSGKTIMRLFQGSNAAAPWFYTVMHDFIAGMYTSSLREQLFAQEVDYMQSLNQKYSDTQMAAFEYIVLRDLPTDSHWCVLWPRVSRLCHTISSRMLVHLWYCLRY